MGIHKTYRLTTLLLKKKKAEQKDET